MATALHSTQAGPEPLDDQQDCWYACYTRARHEKRVAGHLLERGFESFLPLVPRVSQWKDRRRVVEWPMYPSYVFGRFALTAADRVLAVPGVVTLVRTGDRPIPIGEEDLENVRRFALALCASGREVEQRPYFAQGEPVEVQSGPFAGIRGEVVEDRGRQRVLIGLKQIGQGTIVDVEAGTLRSLRTS